MQSLFCEIYNLQIFLQNLQNIWPSNPLLWLGHLTTTIAYNVMGIWTDLSFKVQVSKGLPGVDVDVSNWSSHNLEGKLLLGKENDFT